MSTPSRTPNQDRNLDRNPFLPAVDDEVERRIRKVEQQAADDNYAITQTVEQVAGDVSTISTTVYNASSVTIGDSADVPLYAGEYVEPGGYTAPTSTSGNTYGGEPVLGRINAVPVQLQAGTFSAASIFTATGDGLATNRYKGCFVAGIYDEAGALMAQFKWSFSGLVTYNTKVFIETSGSLTVPVAGNYILAWGMTGPYDARPGFYYTNDGLENFVAGVHPEVPVASMGQQRTPVGWSGSTTVWPTSGRRNGRAKDGYWVASALDIDLPAVLPDLTTWSTVQNVCLRLWLKVA